MTHTLTPRDARVTFPVDAARAALTLHEDGAPIATPSDAVLRRVADDAVPAVLALAAERGATADDLPTLWHLVLAGYSSRLAYSTSSDADGSAHVTATPVVNRPERATRAPHAFFRPEDMRHGAPRPGTAPDPFDGVRHAVKRGRSKRGATAKVTARGVIRHTVGSWEWQDNRVSTDGPAVSDARRALAAYIGRTKRNDGGSWSDRDLSAAADAILGDAVPRMLGGHDMSWEQVIHAGDGTADAYSVAWHNPGIDGGITRFLPIAWRGPNGALHTATAADLADAATPVTARRCQVRDHRPRTALRYRRRAGENASASVVDWQGARVVRLWSAAERADAGYLGHVRVARVLPTGARVARQARTTLRNSDATSADISRAVAMLNRGERAVLAGETFTVTITRAPSGPYSARVRSGDDVRKVAGARSPDAAVRRILAALAD